MSRPETSGVEQALNAFQAYLSYERRYSQHTCTAYMKDLDLFRVFLLALPGEPDLFSCSRQHLKLWMASALEQGLSRRTLARRAATLRSFYRFLRKNNPEMQDPTKGLRLPKPEQRLPQFLPERVLPELMNVLNENTDFFGVQEKTIVLLFLFTGMRRAELSDLNMNSYDPRRCEIRVMGKRSKMRAIPLHPAMKQLLDIFIDLRREMESAEPSDPLFIGLGGQRFKGWAIYRIVVKNLSKVCSLEYRGPHLLRHSFATWMLNQGAGIESLREMLGHTSLAATQVYTHNSIEKLRAVYRKAHPRGGEGA